MASRSLRDAAASATPFFARSLANHAYVKAVARRVASVSGRIALHAVMRSRKNHQQVKVRSLKALKSATWSIFVNALDIVLHCNGAVHVARPGSRRPVM